jgi:hypothetical protein
MMTGLTMTGLTMVGLTTAGLTTAGVVATHAGIGHVGPLVGVVPVEPDDGTARRWLTEELARPEYLDQQTLLDRLLTWFLGLFSDLRGLPAPSWQVIAVLVAVVAVVVVIALVVTGPLRAARRRGMPGALVAVDDVRSASQLRAAADAAAGAGDWSVAVTERFRAIVRSLEERTVLAEQPGRTAQEAAVAGGSRLPAYAGDLYAGASLFDAVVYGHRRAAPGDDGFLAGLDARLLAAAVVDLAALDLGGDGGRDDAVVTDALAVR